MIINACGTIDGMRIDVQYHLKYMEFYFYAPYSPSSYDASSREHCAIT
jgi:hypothetical protein